MMAWIAGAIDGIRGRMELIRIEVDKPDAHIVALRDEVKAIPRGCGMLSREKLNSSRMGVHPDNRYGDGTVASKVLNLISGIFTQGFSLKALQDPTCFEMPPMNTKRFQQYTDFNNECMAQSAGQLPHYKDAIRHVSLTCGHTSQGFRCWQEGVDHSDDRFTQGGKLSIRRLEELQPAYADAVNNGIEWDVFRWQFEEAFPWTPSLFQEAGNATQQIAACESRLEVMMKIRQIAKRNATKNSSAAGLGDPDWAKVKQEAIRSGSPFASEIDGLTEFVKELSGGLEDPVFLNEFKAFCKQLKVERIIRGVICNAVAKLKIGIEGNAPLFRMAAMKAMASASDKYSRGEEQALFKTSDIATFASEKKKAMVMSCESFLLKVREVAKKEGLRAEMWDTVVGLADVRMIHYIANKPDQNRGIYNSLGAIGYAFVQEMAQMLKRVIQSPWPPPKGGTGPAIAASSASSTVKVFSREGHWANIADTLKAKGFAIDAKVAHAKSDAIFTISAIDEKNITLVDAVGAQTKHQHELFMDGSYNLHTDIKEEFDKWAEHDPCNMFDWMWTVREAAVTIALHELHMESRSCISNLKAIIAPNKAKGIITTKDCPKGSLTLIPMTTSILLKNITEEPPASSVILPATFRHPSKQATYNVVLSASGGWKLPDEKKTNGYADGNQKR